MKIIKSVQRICCILMLSVIALTGCASNRDNLTTPRPTEIQPSEPMNSVEETIGIDTEKTEPTEEAADKDPQKTVEPTITEVDWSDYFEEINGAAVLYDPTENGYQIYHQELALTRRSPCSTFKIVSSLVALEAGIIEPDHSTRSWSGERFWNKDWNRDIDFSDAFRTSCVWYFREIIDEIGKDKMQEKLDQLQYGNCDLSDWAGALNNNNSNPALTGFWIESSLLISPKEQAEVMERIFGDHTTYAEELRNQLKQVMMLSEENQSNLSIYGKTGMGKSHGIVVDAWFTGFAETPEKSIYFCIYLGQTDDKEVSSAKAREIAVQIVSDYLN